jgi:predicted RNA-binding Zn-ribbon protein involved in translation (DUF1610 family)
METPNATHWDLGPRPAICTRCGAEAEWSYAGSDQTQVEVNCPDCGKFEISRAEFDQAESEIVELEEPQ